VEEEGCHFQIINGNGTRGVVCGLELGDNVWRPFHPPHNGMKVVGTRKPNSTSTKLAGITESNVMREIGD
jgi:hypothetical protein